MLVQKLNSGTTIPGRELRHFKFDNVDPKTLANGLNSLKASAIFSNLLPAYPPEEINRMAGWVQKANSLYEQVPAEKRLVLLPEWQLDSLKVHFPEASSIFFSLHGQAVLAQCKDTAEGIEISLQAASGHAPQGTRALEGFLTFILKANVIFILGKYRPVKKMASELRNLLEGLRIRIPVIWNRNYIFGYAGEEIPADR